MRTITKHKLPLLLLLFFFAACCICAMQISGWWRPLYQQRTWDRDNQGCWRESLFAAIHPSVPPFIPLFLCPLQKSVVILSFSVQTGHRGSHLAKVCAAPAAAGERERCNCTESNSTDYRQWHSLPLSLSPSLCFISMVHTRRPGRLYTGRGGQEQRENGVGRWGWSVWGG